MLILRFAKNEELNLIALVLGSASPRRSQLLRQLNLSFDVITPDIDETPMVGEQACDYAIRMSKGKSVAARHLLEADAADASKRDLEVVVLCADTIVVLDNEILCKPKDEEDPKAETVEERAEETSGVR